MRWSPGGRSSNLEDRRGGGGRFIGGAGGLGAGTIIILIILSIVFKRDMFQLVSDPGVGAGPETAAGPPAETTPAEERLVDFVSFVLDDAQETSGRRSAAAGARTRTRSWCSSATPSSRRAASRSRRPGRSTARPTRRSTSTWVSIEELQRRFGAPGRLRAGVRAGARDRPPRAELCSAPRPQVRRAAAAARQRRGQRALRPARAAGRLLCRRLGPRTAQREICSSGAMSRKGSGPRPRSVTTGSSG